MAPKIDRFWEGYITALSHQNFSYSQIVKTCADHDFVLSKQSVSHVLNGDGKCRNSAQPAVPGPSRKRPTPRRTAEVVKKVRRLVTGPNPPTQRTIAKAVQVPQATVHDIIKKNLCLVTRHKSRVHNLSPKHIRERKTNCRKLYERYLAGDKWQYVVTLDEAYVYLDDCNKCRSIFYRPIGEKNYQRWFKECRESFPKGFMVIAGYCYKGQLAIRRVAKNVKVNSLYYQSNVLDQIYNTDIPGLYGVDTNKVWLHQDKASGLRSHILLSWNNGLVLVPYPSVTSQSSRLTHHQWTFAPLGF